MRFDEAVAELDSRIPSRMIPDLTRITALTEMMGDPQLTYPSIHVTGTNGKTTTSRFVSALSCAHGITSGLYTSPHLESVVERLSSCGEPISQEAFAEQYERLVPFLHVVDELGEKVTFFEVLTALAYMWFSDKPVSLGVFEVGMGGEWDATNLVSGDVAIICPIALDHPELGPTIAEKAQEKAGIIKEGKIVVVREQPPDALGVIEARARDVGARLLLEDADFSTEDRANAFGGQLITVRGLHGIYEDLMLPVFGEHAARNASAAIVAMEAFLDRPLADVETRAAFAEIGSPGRLEVIGRHPLVILDGAHNPAGAAALADALEESFTWDQLFLVVAVSSDKDVAGILDPLAPTVTRAFATSYRGARAVGPDELASRCGAAGIPSEACPTIRDALGEAAEVAGDTDLILVTGSLFTVAEARALLAGSA